MAFAFKGTTAVFGDRAGNGTFTPAFPANATTNDLALLFAYLDSGTASGPEANGWTVATGSPYGGAVPRGYLWYRRLQAGDVAPQITIASVGVSTASSEAGYITYSSDAKITPVEATSAGTSGLGSPALVNAVTSLSANAILVAFIGRGDNETFGSQAIGGSTTGVVERVDQGSALGDNAQINIFDKTLAVAGSSGTATAVTSTTDPFVSVMVALSPRVEVPVTGVRAQASPAGQAGSPKLVMGGVRAAAAPVAGRAGSPKVVATGVRAAGVSSGRAGSPIVRVTGVRATTIAAGRAGTFGASQLVTGVRAHAGPAHWDVRLTATNAGGSNTKTRSAYVSLGVQPAGSPVVRVTGVRAQTTAAGRAGAPTVPGVNITVTGVRAVAAANPHHWAVRLTATNAGGSNTKTQVGYVGLGAVGTPKVTATGVRAAATAAGRAGLTFGSVVAVVGVRAAASASGQAGTLHASSVLVGTRAQAAAAGRAGVALNIENRAVTGVRAQATATGQAGSPKVTVTGVRAAATATARAGASDISAAAIVVTGTRAAAAADGRAGLPKIAIGGVRGGAAAAAKAGSPVVRVGGVRSSSTGSGRNGVVVFSGAAAGSRATATAAGRAGVAGVAGNRVVVGGRAAATGSAQAGGTRNVLTGVAATATSSAGAGAFVYSASTLGARALAVASGQVGPAGQVASPARTYRTRVLVRATRTIANVPLVRR